MLENSQSASNSLNCQETRGLAFKNGPDELPVSWWEERAQKIIFSSKEIFFFVCLYRSVCWWIWYRSAQGQAIGKQSYGGGQKGLTDSLFKGNRIYPPPMPQTPQKTYDTWTCIQLTHVSRHHLLQMEQNEGKAVLLSPMPSEPQPKGQGLLLAPGGRATLLPNLRRTGNDRRLRRDTHPLGVVWGF